MASLELRNKVYSVVFRYGGRKFSRTLKTGSRKEASARLTRLEENVRLVESGRLEIPPNADVAVFLLSDGRVNHRPVSRKVLLEDLFTQFFDSLPNGSLENSTIATMHIHKRHLESKLGKKFEVQKLAMGDLQRYVQLRTGDPGLRGKTLGSSTVQKELTTFRLVWNWAVDANLIVGKFPKKGVRLPKTKQPPPFKTWREIEAVVQNMEPQEAQEHWDCLFLRLEEVEELLKHVKETARHLFLFPMFATAAYTGARRSELMRSRLSDIDRDTIIIRERKRKHGQATTRRVPMSKKLKTILAEWKHNHPGGLFTFCHTAMPRSRSRKKVAIPQSISRDQAHDHFTRALKGSKWEVVRGWHCFRHSFISNLASHGVDQRLIDEFVGHTSEEVKRRYRHLLPDVKQAAIDSVFE